MIVRVASASLRSVTVVAPAKVNVTLAILGRRPDGFHAIDTIMLPVSLGDRLTARRAPPGRLTLSIRNGPRGISTGEENTVLRAARLLGGGVAGAPGAALLLEKRTPMGAGLGGGSSDGAAALAALDRLWRLGTPPARLRRLAARIGSDVPFFLGSGAARARGRGERISPVVCPKPFHLVLVHPGFALPTKDVYGALRRFAPWERRGAVRMDGMLRALRRGDPSALAAALMNDLEAPARWLAPRLQALRSALERMPFLGVGMSGSGSCYFGVCRDAASARALAREAADRGLGGAWAVEAG